MSRRIYSSAMSAAYFIQREGERVKGRVLDVGCGAMPYRRLFRQLEWVGLDSRPVGQIEADFHELPFDDDSFDTVICTDALQFARSPQKVVDEMARVLRPAGVLLLLTPGLARSDEGALWAFTEEGVEILLRETELAVERVSASPSPWGGATLGHLTDYCSSAPAAPDATADLRGWASRMDKLYPQWIEAVATRPVAGRSQAE